VAEQLVDGLFRVAPGQNDVQIAFGFGFPVGR
jgi:hypothetical protein